MLKWALILLTVFVSSAGDILCAKGMSQSGELHAHGVSALARVVRFMVTRKLVITGVFCYAVAFFSLMGLLSVAKLSVAVPATALSFVVDTLGARFILRERIPWKRWVGVVCVTIGVILVIQPTQRVPVQKVQNTAGEKGRVFVRYEVPGTSNGAKSARLTQ